MPSALVTMIRGNASNADQASTLAKNRPMNSFVTWVKTHLRKPHLRLRKPSSRSALHQSQLSISEDEARTASNSDFGSLSSSSRTASSITDSTACEAETQLTSTEPALPACHRPEHSTLVPLPLQEVPQHGELFSLTEDTPHYQEVQSLRSTERTPSGAPDEAASECESETSTLCSTTSSIP